MTLCFQPTAPQCPLHAITLFKLLREEEVEDWAQAGEGQSQSKGQSQLLPFEPECSDAVLDNWRENKPHSSSRKCFFNWTLKCFSAAALLVRDPLPDPKSNRPVSISGSRYGVPLKWEPNANSEEPKTHRKENRKTPTAERGGRALIEREWLLITDHKHRMTLWQRRKNALDM